MNATRALNTRRYSFSREASLRTESLYFDQLTMVRQVAGEVTELPIGTAGA